MGLRGMITGRLLRVVITRGGEMFTMGLICILHLSCGALQSVRHARFFFSTGFPTRG